MTRPTHIEAQDPAYRRYRRRVWTVAAVIALLTLVALPLLDTLALAFGVAAYGLLIVHVLLQLRHHTQVENFLHYRQLAALMNLHSLIDLNYPLPPMRLWAASPDFAVLVAGIILQHRPAQVMELGSGTSTLIAAYCLEQLGEGRILSLDHDAYFASRSRELLDQHQLAARANVIHAALTTIADRHRWYDLNAVGELPKIDLLIVDGPPEIPGELARYPALPALFEHLNPGALILVDDYLRDAERAMVARWLDEFGLEMVEEMLNEKGAALLKKKEDTVA